MKIEVISETWASSDEENHHVADKEEGGLSQEHEVLVRTLAQHESIHLVDQRSTTIAATAIRSIVEHYRQPIHRESATSTMPILQSPPPRIPFVEHWVKTLSSSSDNDEPDYMLLYSILHMYVTEIRPVVFPGLEREERSNTVALEGVPVLQHYEILLARLWEERNPLQTTSSVSKNDGNDNQSDQHAISGKKTNSNSSNNNQSLLPLLQLLASDVTSQIQSCHQLVHQSQDHETNHHHTTENDVAEATMTTHDREIVTQQQAQSYTKTRHIVLPLLLKLIHRAWALQTNAMTNSFNDNNSDQDAETEHREWINVQAHCIMIFLAFGRPILGPQHMDETLKEHVASVQHSDTTMLDEIQRTDLNLENKAKLMDWASLELPSTVWEDNNVIDPMSKTQQLLTDFWQGLLDSQFQTSTNNDIEVISTKMPKGETSSAAKYQNAFFRRLLKRGDESSEWLLSLAQACRAHFFGRDLMSTSTSNKQDTWRIIPLPKTTKTRLHLGRTITEEAKSYQKPYQEVPSRVHTACWLISLVTDSRSHSLSEKILEELWPIVYELLTAPRAILVALGAVCVKRLLSVAKTTPAAVLENLKRMLESTIRSVRESAPLTMIGVAQQSLWMNSTSHFGKEHRLQALQQWLTILNKNQTLQMPLSWACFVGGALPLLEPFSQEPNAANSLGRLGLMALLPSIQMENMSQDEIFGSAYTHEVQWLALIAFSKFLTAAKSVMPRHGGKILSALLVARMDGTDKRVQVWARHVSYQAFRTCGKRGREFLHQIIDSGEYQESFVAVAKDIEHHGSRSDKEASDSS